MPITYNIEIDIDTKGVLLIIRHVADQKVTAGLCQHVVVDGILSNIPLFIRHLFLCVGNTFIIAVM